MELVAAESPREEQQQQQQEAKKEVGICRFFFENGRCLKGSNCPYSHSLAALVKSGGITKTRPVGLRMKQQQQQPRHRRKKKAGEGGDSVDEDGGQPFAPPFMPEPICFIPPVPEEHEGDKKGSRVVLAALQSPASLQPLFVPVPISSPGKEGEAEDGSTDGESSEGTDGQGSEDVEPQEEEPRRMCSYFYHLGFCKKGDSCEFSHEWSPEMEEPPPPAVLVGDKKRASSTEKHTATGRQQPQQTTGGGQSLTGKLLESASRRFFDPVCGEDTTGMTLPRRHVPRQPYGTYSPSFLASGLFRSKPCTFFFETGFCLKGDHCNFSHDPHLLLEQSYAKQQHQQPSSVHQDQE